MSFTCTRSFLTATSYLIPRRPACRTSHTWVLSRRTPSFLVALGRVLVGTPSEKSCRIICRRVEWTWRTERRGICNSKEANVCDTVSRTGATTFQNFQYHARTVRKFDHLVRDEITETVKHGYAEQLCGQMIAPSFVCEIILFGRLTIWKGLRKYTDGRGENVPFMPPHLPWSLRSSRKHKAAPCLTSQA